MSNQKTLFTIDPKPILPPMNIYEQMCEVIEFLEEEIDHFTMSFDVRRKGDEVFAAISTKSFADEVKFRVSNVSAFQNEVYTMIEVQDSAGNWHIVENGGHSKYLWWIFYNSI